MNSTTAPKAIEPDDVVVARADERLVHAYDQIARADEQLARLNEQLARLEQEAKHQPSAVVGHRPSRSGPALRGFIGLLLAVCVFAFAFVSQSSYGEAAKSTVARWAPQLIGFVAPDRETGGARAAGPIYRSTGRGDRRASAINTFGSDGPAGRRAGSRPDTAELAQLLQTMARDLANLEQGIGQLKANQEQIGPRQREGHRGAQGEPGANDAPDRQAFRQTRFPSRTCGPGIGDSAAAVAAAEDLCRCVRRRKPERGRRPRCSCSPTTTSSRPRKRRDGNRSDQDHKHDLQTHEACFLRKQVLGCQTIATILSLCCHFMGTTATADPSACR